MDGNRAGRRQAGAHHFVGGVVPQPLHVLPLPPLAGRHAATGWERSAGSWERGSGRCGPLCPRQASTAAASCPGGQQSGLQRLGEQTSAERALKWRTALLPCWLDLRLWR